MKIFPRLLVKFKNYSAFTIVEVLVVAPIVILTIATFIGVIITITGDAIATRSQNILSYNVQDSLNRIEQDVSRATSFLSVNNVSISSPQGYNNDATAFTNVGSNGNMLILSVPATNKNPMSNDYTPIYLSNSPYDCSSADVRKNTQMMINTVYFVKDGTLWRRTLMPSNYATAGCAVPYQKPSCAPGQVSAMCASEDIRIADNITASNFTINYFTSASSSNSLATSIDSNASNATRTAELNSAKSVNVSISLSRNIAGRAISRSDSQRMIRSLAPNATNRVSSLVNCPTGFIVVPGSSTYGTSDFCVMKYEAKCASTSALSVGLTTATNTYNNTTTACTAANSRAVVSVASGNPIVNISQTDSSTYAAATSGCTGCKLITEAEWLTIAQNVLSNPVNWSNNAVGSGFIYSGHNDNAPANSLPASIDTDGYSGTGQTSGNQKRTLTLTNGETIWDMAGNVMEWTSGQTTGGQPSPTGWAWREWTAVSGGTISPSPFPSTTAISGSGSWTSANGIGMIYSNSSDIGLRGFLRGGGYYATSNVGILSINLGNSPSLSNGEVGFRVTK